MIGPLYYRPTFVLTVLISTGWRIRADQILSAVLTHRPFSSLLHQLTQKCSFKYRFHKTRKKATWYQICRLWRLSKCGVMQPTIASKKLLFVQTLCSDEEWNLFLTVLDFVLLYSQRCQNFLILVVV